MGKEWNNIQGYSVQYQIYYQYFNGTIIAL